MDKELVVQVELVFLMSESAQVCTATHNLENKLEELMNKQMPGVGLASFSIETNG